jgi:FkbM family methyltransferase
MGVLGDWWALLRSWRTYHSDPKQDRLMDDLYRRFVKAGDLVFDIGANVGHRTASFRRLGARVVALEPQPRAAQFIRLFHARSGDVKVLQAACGSSPGRIILHVNSSNPLVSTASGAFIESAQGASGWEGQNWDRTIEVPMTNLNALIDAHGVPSFIKIDVEGFEGEVLSGLSRQVPALSFEFTTIQRGQAQECVEKCTRLGYSDFNACVGESHVFAFSENVGAPEIKAWLASLPDSANSGDVYAISSSTS